MARQGRQGVVSSVQVWRGETGLDKAGEARNGRVLCGVKRYGRRGSYGRGRASFGKAGQAWRVKVGMAFRGRLGLGIYFTFNSPNLLYSWCV